MVAANGQQFLFRPRPARPPIFVGGAPPQALARAIRFGDGWMPMGVDPEKLRAPIAELRRLAAEAGRGAPEVVAMGRLPLEEPVRAAEQVALALRRSVSRAWCTRSATRIRTHSGGSRSGWRPSRRARAKAR